MLLDVSEEIIIEMASKRMTIFAPRSGKDLKREYPELDDYPEFRGLSGEELLFVWAWACPTSPFIDIVEEKRCTPCIDFAFKRPHQNEARKQAYGASTGAAPSFPDEIKNAIKRMERFNPGLRIQMAVDNMHLLSQCQRAIRRDISGASPEEMEEYMKTAKIARQLMSDIHKDIERGNMGADELENTMTKNLEGASAAFHKSRS
ncbi:MAG: hypothetical protein E6Q97_11590 [Desulfurellales bacterium]|nr:MAG: hypothetical protein E6Q97_11590 [Desulfurellales bacterium]